MKNVEQLKHDLTKIKTSISRSTSTPKVKSNNEEKVKNEDIIRKTKIDDKYIATDILSTKDTEILDSETDLLEEETNILEEETGLLEEETGLLDEETGILDEETGLFEEETNLLEEVLEDGEYVKEIDIVVVNYTSIINI